MPKLFPGSGSLRAGGRPRSPAAAARRERFRRRLRDWVFRVLTPRDRGPAAPGPLVREARPRRLPRRAACRPGTRGFTLTELLAALALVGVLGAMAIPPLANSFRTQQVRHAAMAMRSLLQRARAEAAARAANVAVVFDPPTPGAGGSTGPSGRPPVVAVYLDANHNGVRRAEIAAGGERLLRAGWRFDERFSGVEWGASAEDAGGNAIPGLAVGAARMVSFSPLGSSGAGRITVSGAGVVYSIVIHGGSSRIRLERRAGTVWVPA